MGEPYTGGQSLRGLDEQTTTARPPIGPEGDKPQRAKRGWLSRLERREGFRRNVNVRVVIYELARNQDILRRR